MKQPTGCSVPKANAAVRGKGNKQRQNETTQAIEDKVLVLEAVAKREMPLFEGLPTSMRGFREWVDPSHQLVRIGSPSSTDPKLAEHNEELIGRAYSAMRTISTLLRTQKLRVYVPLGSQLGRCKEQLERSAEENRRLGSEVLRFKHLCDVTSIELKAARADAENFKRELNALRAEYVRATSTRPRRVK